MSTIRIFHCNFAVDLNIMAPMDTETKLQKKLRKLLDKAIFDYHLIEDGDKVLVGLSGGKDSLFLTDILAERMKIWKPKFTVEALHVRMKHIDYQTSTDYLQSFCDKLGIPLHIEETDFNPSTDRRKVPCFLCSWYRRKVLFEKAKALGCNRIAFGHHQDDIIHTALLNQLYQGRYATMPVLLQMDKMPFSIIRPLCLMQEKDIMQMAAYRHYEKQAKLCPYEKTSNRDYVAHLFEEIEKHNPEARYSMWHAFEKADILVSKAPIDIDSATELD